MKNSNQISIKLQQCEWAVRFDLSLAALLVALAIILPGKSFAALAASVLPSSRSAEVGTTVTAFATIINAGPGTATGCSISPVTPVSADFLYQTTDPATNALSGTPDTPVDIADGAAQSFVFAFTPTAPFAPTDVQLSFDCTNTVPVATISGVNTLLLSASASPVPDIIALATGTGTIDMPASAGGVAAFAVATVNVGTTGTITASADTGSAVSLPVSISVCQTNPVSGVCINPSVPAGTATTTIADGETPTFAFFLTASGPIPFDPANNRAFVRFTDSGAIVRGSTSTALMSDVSSFADVTGTYSGSGTATLSGCLNPSDNITLGFNASISIPSQSGDSFSGTATLTTTIQGVNLTENNNISGTVDSQGAVNGTISGDLLVDGFFDSSSQGTFAGTLSGNSLSIQVLTQDTVGDTCTTTGSFTVSR